MQHILKTNQSLAYFHPPPPKIMPAIVASTSMSITQKVPSSRKGKRGKMGESERGEDLCMYVCEREIELRFCERESRDCVRERVEIV